MGENEEQSDLDFEFAKQPGPRTSGRPSNKSRATWGLYLDPWANPKVDPP